MAERPQPQPRQGVVAGQFDRRLETVERLTEVPLALRLPAALDQAVDFGGHGDKNNVRRRSLLRSAYRVRKRSNSGSSISWAGSTGVYLSRVASFMASSTLKSTGVKPLSVKMPRARSRITSAAPCLRASTVIMAAPQQARALTARPAEPAASAGTASPRSPP